LYVVGDLLSRTASTTLTAYTYNRALDADDVAYLYKYGVHPADRWGSMTELYTGANAANRDNEVNAVTGWLNGYGSPTITSVMEDNGISPQHGSYQLKITATSNGQRKDYKFPTEIGKRYFLCLDYIKYQGSNPIAAYVAPNDVSDNYSDRLDGTLTVLTSATYSSATMTFIATSNLSYLSIRQLATASIASIVYIDNVLIKQLGATLALEPENIQLSPGQWLDAANSHHAKLPEEGATLIRPQKEGYIEWTNTWSSSSAGQYLGGINEDIFPSNDIRIEFINMKCTATGVNITIGDQTDTDRYVESVALTDELDIGSPAHVNHDGTNLKLVVTPDSTYTGSIKTTIKYILA